MGHHLNGEDWLVIAGMLTMGAGLMAGLLRILIYDFDDPVVPKEEWTEVRTVYKDPAWTPEDAAKAAFHPQAAPDARTR